MARTLPRSLGTLRRAETPRARRTSVCAEAWRLLRALIYHRVSMPPDDASDLRLAARRTTAARRDRCVFVRFALASLLALLVIACAPVVAYAHPLLDEGERKYEDADFQGALDAFARAEQASDLTRDDLVRLYTRRAMVHHGMQHPEELEADVFRLAHLDRALRLPRAAPPAVRRAYEQAVTRVSGTLRVDVEVESIPGGTRLVARVSDDNAGLVQSLRVRARTAGGAWRRTERATLEVPAAAGATVEYVAEAIGPGGAVLAQAGTDDAPLRTTLAALGASTPAADVGTPAATTTTGGDTALVSTGTPATPRVDEGGAPVWPWLVAGGVVIAAAAVVVALFVVPGPDGDQPISGPQVTF